MFPMTSSSSSSSSRRAVSQTPSKPRSAASLSSAASASKNSNNTPSQLKASSSTSNKAKQNLRGGTAVSSYPSPSSSSSFSGLSRAKSASRVTPLLHSHHAAAEESSNQRARRLLPIVNKSSNTSIPKSSGAAGRGGREELRDRLDQSEALIRDLHSQVSELRAELEKARNSNAKLQSHNGKLSEDLAAAEAKIAAFTTATATATIHTPTDDKMDFTVDHQSSRFKDIQKIIADKLERSKFKYDAGSGASPIKRAEPKQLVPVTVNVQSNASANLLPALPPAPPPPPVWAPKWGVAATQRNPAAAESYHSLKKHAGSEDNLVSENRNMPVNFSAHSSIVGEIQRRSAHVLAIKADIETKGQLINDLIEKVLDAAYTDIEDVVKFVDWLDNELSSLADERAVLKHFKWPECKADALREAAVEYRCLELLEREISSYKDDTSIPCGVSLKKMAALLDKSEQSTQRLIKLRKSALISYQQFKIPTDWMLDSGIISKIKRSSGILAKVYMKRVMMELESAQLPEREFTQEGLLTQGVDFAYRAHQFAGGLDSETLCVFEEIRQHVPGHLRGYQELLAGILAS